MNQDFTQLDTTFKLIERQLYAMWGLPTAERSQLEQIFPKAFQMIQNCLATYKAPTVFSALNSDHCCTFMQYLRQCLELGCPLNEKLFLLLKMMYAVDFYSATLPAAINLTHPLGSLLGKGRVGDKVCIYQQVTIGGNRDQTGDLMYPEIKGPAMIYAGSLIVGNSVISENVVCLPGTRIVNQSVPPNTMVSGVSPKLTFLPLFPYRLQQLSPFTLDLND